MSWPSMRGQRVLTGGASAGNGRSSADAFTSCYAESMVDIYATVRSSGV